MQLKITKYTALAILMLFGIPAVAQITTESPYSRFGLGNLTNNSLPKYKGMGGIGIGMNAPTAFSYVNTQNPATYTSFALTSIEAGMSGTYVNLKQGNESARSLNGTFNHIVLGFPVNRKSGMSVGLLPYSKLGYEYSSSSTLDTLKTNNSASGEGGLTKAYLGYGYIVAKGFRVGVNMEYIFGSMIRTRSSEILDPTSINVRIQDRDNVYGLSFSYGAQYDIELNSKTKLILGYTGNAPSKLNSKFTNIITRYTKDLDGNDNPAIDTVQTNSSVVNKFKLPLTHGFGFSIQKYNNWVFGGDVKFGNWSKLEIGGVNQGLQNTFSASVGAQLTPDVTAVSGYFKRVDYRLGLTYDKSYVRVSNQDITQKSITMGLGLPLSSVNRFTFSRINIAAELGTRGTLSNNLVKENFVNVHLGFALNDKWFNRFRFD